MTSDEYMEPFTITTASSASSSPSPLPSSSTAPSSSSSVLRYAPQVVATLKQSKKVRMIHASSDLVAICLQKPDSVHVYRLALHESPSSSSSSSSPSSSKWMFTHVADDAVPRMATVLQWLPSVADRSCMMSADVHGHLYLLSLPSSSTASTLPLILQQDGFEFCDDSFSSLCAGSFKRQPAINSGGAIQTYIGTTLNGSLYVICEVSSADARILAEFQRRMAASPITKYTFRSQHYHVAASFVTICCGGEIGLC